MWSEIYRPKEIDEIVLAEDIKSKMYQYIEEREFPHLILYGCPGCGKSTLGDILADKVAGGNVKHQNSSHYTGVDNVRGDIARFCSTGPSMQLFGDCNSETENDPIIEKPLKIFILNEVDAMSQDAQQALQTLMEDFYSNARFILLTNFPPKISEAIKSRCTSYDLQEPPKNDCRDRLAHILNEEGVQYVKSSLETIVNEYYPDIRQMIHEVQRLSLSNKKNNLVLCIHGQNKSHHKSKEKDAHITLFIQEVCYMVNRDKYTSSEALFYEYQKWIENKNIPKKDSLSHIGFGRMMSNQFESKRKWINGKQKRCYIGVGIKKKSKDTG